MMIYLISTKELLKTDEKTVVTEVGTRSINESSTKRKQIDVTAVVASFFKSHAKVLTQM